MQLVLTHEDKEAFFPPKRRRFVYPGHLIEKKSDDEDSGAGHGVSAGGGAAAALALVAFEPRSAGESVS